MSSGQSYDQAHPAEHINELLDALERDDASSYLYRGQVRPYAAMLPSVFRKAASKVMLGRHLHSIDADAFHANMKNRDRLRFRLFAYLIRSLGRGVGNLVAQQYGLSSEAIDLSASPQVAAYFATRDYPAYDHFAGSADVPCGVLYRFPKGSAVRTLAGLEETLARLGHHAPDGPCWFDSCVRRDDDTPLLHDAERLLEQHGREELILFSQPVIVDYADFHGHLREALARVTDSVSVRIEDTRIARQLGGFIMPPIRWRCTVPKARHVDTQYLLSYRAYYPGFAVKEQLVAVEDTAAAPGREVFYFRHSAARVDAVTRRHLWPSSTADQLYELLNEICLDDREICQHLEDKDTWLEDPQDGVLDRGFYTGAETAAWKARTAQRDGDDRAALGFIEQALAADVTNDEHYLVRATLHTAAGDYAEALADVDRALVIEPGSWPAAANRAAILVRMGDAPAAIASLDRAIAVNPSRPQLYLARAETWAQIRDSDRVIHDCDEALHRLGALSSQLTMRVPILKLKALALTAAHRDVDADGVLDQLTAFEIGGLRAHIADMRAQRDRFTR